MNTQSIFINRPDLDVHETRHYDTVVVAGTNIAHNDFKASPGRWVITAEEQAEAKENISRLEVDMSHPDAWRIECALRIKSQNAQ